MLQFDDRLIINTLTVKEIPLSRGLVALVDDRDFKRVSQFKWSAAEPNPGKFYAVRHVLKDGQHGKRRTIYLHRFILKSSPRVHIDHKDGNGLNCQRNNVRLATRAQNGQNRGPSKSRRFKGVYPRAKSRFAAYIGDRGKTIYLGCFPSEEEAAKAYDARASVLHGEFARLNFPT